MRCGPGELCTAGVCLPVMGGECEARRELHTRGRGEKDKLYERRKKTQERSKEAVKEGKR